MNSSSQSLNDDILFELDKLGVGSVKRRLTNELVQFKKQGAYIHVECILDNTNTENYINTTNTENYINTTNTINNNYNYQKSYVTVSIMLNGDNTLYQFDITSGYPFKSPTMLRINYQDYRFNYLKIHSEKTVNELKEFIKFDCLCCSTLLCNDNWSPAMRLIKIIEEVKQIKHCRKIIIHRLLAKKIIDRYLIDDINLYEWLF